MFSSQTLVPLSVCMCLVFAAILVPFLAIRVRRTVYIHICECINVRLYVWIDVEFVIHLLKKKHSSSFPPSLPHSPHSKTWLRESNDEIITCKDEPTDLPELFFTHPHTHTQKDFFPRFCTFKTFPANSARTPLLTSCSMLFSPVAPTSQSF